MGGACVVNKRLEKVSPGKETTKRKSVRRDRGKDKSQPGKREQDSVTGHGRVGKEGL